MTLVFSCSAFKHGITEVDISMAFDNVLYDERLDESDEDDDFSARYLLIGFDRKANLLEIVYHVIDDDTIKVFHVMKCRSMYMPLLKHKE